MSIGLVFGPRTTHFRLAALKTPRRHDTFHCNAQPATFFSAPVARTTETDPGAGAAAGGQKQKHGQDERKKRRMNLRTAEG